MTNIWASVFSLRNLLDRKVHPCRIMTHRGVFYSNTMAVHCIYRFVLHSTRWAGQTVPENSPLLGFSVFGSPWSVEVRNAGNSDKDFSSENHFSRLSAVPLCVLLYMAHGERRSRASG